MHVRFVLTVLALTAGVAAADHGAAANGKAPLLGNLGNRHYKVTTTNDDAQRYFDQGLTLCWAFNHPEAIRSFQRAAKLDPDCAMAYWGLAFAYGPNINLPMGEDVNDKAYAAAQKALELAGKCTPKEQAYIRAMAKRYAKDAPKDRAPLDRAFADGMRELHLAHPDDLDGAVLFAESLMDTMPWNYWTEDASRSWRRSRSSRPWKACSRGTRCTLGRTTTTSTQSRRPRARSAGWRRPTGCGTSCRGPVTSSTCRRTSTCASASTTRPACATSARPPSTRRTSASTR
jgi:hypothetical protein